MSEKEINLNVTAEGKEIIILQGKAPNPIEVLPDPLYVEGTLVSPWEFWSKRKKDFESNKCHLQYSLKKGWIKLICDESTQYKHIIEGKIIAYHLIEDLGVNDLNRTYTQTDLLKKFRLLKPFFINPDQHTILMKNLRNVQAKLTTIIETADDQKGNKKDFIERSLSLQMNWDFELHIPIFEGIDPTNLTINLIATYEGSELKFYLESLDLVMKAEILKGQLFADQLDNFTPELVCIEVI